MPKLALLEMVELILQSINCSKNNIGEIMKHPPWTIGCIEVPIPYTISCIEAPPTLDASHVVYNKYLSMKEYITEYFLKRDQIIR